MINMKLSSRMSMLAPEGAFAVLAKAQELERQGKSIVHLEIGQPDFETPKHIAKAGIKAIQEGKTKYTPSLGILPLRQAIAKSITQRTKIETSSKKVAVTPSCKTALFCALAATVNIGDEIIYPEPGFPAYKILIEFFGGKAVPVPLVEEKEFAFDMNIFKKKFSKNTKAIILSFPNNPTGTLLPLENLKEIADLVKGTQCWVISDEIYSQLIYTKEPYISMYSLPSMQDRTIIVDGFSKTYAMTGWRLGYMIAPESIMEKIDYLLTHSFACTATFTQEAGIAAIEGSQKDTETMIKEYKRRRDFVIKELNSMKGVSAMLPHGAFYAFPNVTSFKKSSKYIADYLLEHVGVAVLDGTSFGKYGEGYLRISYATSMKNLQEGLKRVKSGLEKLS